jgi:hypothetical protein
MVKEIRWSISPMIVFGKPTQGAAEAALIEAAGGDLDAYMLAKVNRAVGREVKDRVAPDKF